MKACASALSIVLCASTLFAQSGSVDCGGDNFVSRVTTDQTIIGIAGDGDITATLSAANFRLNLHIWDHSDPLLPAPSTTTELVVGFFGNINHVALSMSGTVVAVGDQTSANVQLFDVSPSFTPVLGSTIAVTASAIQLNGDRLYVLSASALSVYDIADINNPVLLGDLPGAFSDGFEVVNGKLFVGFGSGASGEFRVYDISNPASISQVGMLATGLSVDAIDVEGDLAACSFGGISVALIDVSNPSAPQQVGAVQSNGFIQDIMIHGDRVYSSSSSTVSIVDVSSPSSPVIHGRLAGPDMFSEPQMMLSNNEVWIGTARYLVHVDGSQSVPFEPELFAGTPVGAIAGAKFGFVGTHQGYVYAIDSVNHSFVVIDDSDVSQPIVIGSMNFDFNLVSDIAFAGDRAFVLSGSADISVIDISTPASPSVLGTWNAEPVGPFWGGNLGLEIEGNILYACPRNGAFTVFDITNPLSPTLLSEYFLTDNEISEFKVRDGHALVYSSFFHGGGENGTNLVIDCTDPSSLALVGGGFASDVRDLELVGDRLLSLVTTNNPSHSTLVSVPMGGPYNPAESWISFSHDNSLMNGGFLYQLILSGDRVIVPSNSGIGSSSLAQFDVSDPSAIKYLGGVGIDQALGMHTSAASNGDRLYLVTGTSAVLGIYDISPCQSVCLADLNGDGLLNFFDISAFLNAFAAQDSSADFNGDGLFNFFDISAFLAAFGAGCP